MTESFAIRQATINDVPFICEAIIGAERSLGDRAGIAALFDLSEEDAGKLIGDMLCEEIDGCEFSVSSFLVACAHEVPIAAAAGWIEGLPDGMASSLLKANLIGYTFPHSNVKAAASRRDVVKGIQIEREAGTLQIEYVFTDAAHRGQRLAGQLIDAHILRGRSNSPALAKAQVQVFTDNAPAIAAYARLGFRPMRTYRTDHPDALRYLPSAEKLLMTATLKAE
jgi:ribosomal protein S18 acetylase RimI-like enzyme